MGNKEVEDIEEPVLGLLFVRKGLDIIHKQPIDGCEEILPVLASFSKDEIDVFIDKGIGSNIEDLSVWML